MVNLNSADSTFIIAEAGSNHGGHFELASELITEASAAGADAIKFQMWDPEEFFTDPDTIERAAETQFSPEEWVDLKDIADEECVEFFASAFDESSVDLLVDRLDAPIVKVASSDITHIPLLEYISQKNRPVVLSTGMSTLGEIERAIDTVEPPSADLYLLECVSSYPVDLEDLNLSVIETLQTAFDYSVGFSDHTLGTVAPVVAVGLGAEIVEKHLTLDRDLDSPDHEFSLGPSEFATMVERIRAVEQSLGDGNKRPLPTEKAFMEKGRRGLKARCDINAGEELTRENVKIARPNEGIEPAAYQIALGRDARKDLSQNSPITWDDI